MVSPVVIPVNELKTVRALNCVGGGSDYNWSVPLIDLVFSYLCSFDMCPNNCSGRGECKSSNSSNTVECQCSENWKGESCDIPHCTDNCGFPHRGICNASDVRGCSCSPNWQGRSCLFTVLPVTESSSLVNCKGAYFSSCIFNVNHVSDGTWAFISLYFRFFKFYTHVVVVDILRIMERFDMSFATHSWKLGNMVSC